jgi:hypothetical protein
MLYILQEVSMHYNLGIHKKILSECFGKYE